MLPSAVLLHRDAGHHCEVALRTGAKQLFAPFHDSRVVLKQRRGIGARVLGRESGIDVGLSLGFAIGQALGEALVSSVW